MPNSKEHYIVSALRHGERDAHSYNIGIYTKKHPAIKMADDYCSYRGGKYACIVEKCIINSFSSKEDNYPIEIYRAKSNAEKYR